jgi:ABC-type transporter Mla subunit MlaD
VWKKNETNTALLANDATLVLDHQDLAHALEQNIMDKLDPAIGRIMAMSTEVMDPNKGLPATLQHINATLVSTEKLLNGLNARAQDPRVDHLLTHLDEASASVVKSAELTEKNMAQTKLVLESTKQILDSVHGLVHHSNETLEDFRRGTLGRWIAPPRKAASNPQ